MYNKQVIDGQKFINELTSSYGQQIFDLNLKFENAFIAQDYDGMLRLFSRKPIAYYEVIDGKERILWDRTDEEVNVFMIKLGDKINIFKDNETKVLHLRKFNNRRLDKMKKKFI